MPTAARCRLRDLIFGALIFIAPVQLTSRQNTGVVPQKPRSIPERWVNVVGEYVEGRDTIRVAEKEQQLFVVTKDLQYVPLKNISGETYQSAGNNAVVLNKATQEREFEAKQDTTLYRRLTRGGVFRMKPERPVEELRTLALASTPPTEEGEFRNADLVELSKLDSTIKYDIRYASENNFLGSPFYSQPRAFLQRPAAEALVRAHQWLKRWGYGLLIHDAYRPWFVTKMFWDATPDDKKIFVADPMKGSRHNRGCAVDLTLYDLKTGKTAEMTGGYDEMSERSYATYPGGTSLQRWHRDLLRKAMESQGFLVYPWEWWHFDFKDWNQYRIGTMTFEEILRGKL